MPSAFFVGVVVSLPAGRQVLEYSAFHLQRMWAQVSKPPGLIRGAILHFPQGEADTTRLSDKVGKLILHKVANEVS